MTLARFAAVLLSLGFVSAQAQGLVIDDFREAEGWTAFAPEGVEVAVEADDGALRIEYDFRSGGGFAIVRREVEMEVEGNYAFEFRVRGEGPANDLEFKLIDGTGDNVWWHNRRRFEPPGEWTTLTSSRRSIEFAWGPTQDRTLRRVAAVEFAVASASGGSGTIWIDDLRYRALPEPVAIEAPFVLRRAMSGAVLLANAEPWQELGAVGLGTGIEIDLAGPRALGGLALEWAWAGDPGIYSVYGRSLGGEWSELRGLDQPETRVDVVTFDGTTIDRILLRPTREPLVEMSLLRVRPLPIEAHESPNTLVETLVGAGIRTHLPECYSGERMFWTVCGLPGGAGEALLDELGSVEPVKGGPRLQPALLVGGELVGGWNADERTQSLVDGWKPIPSAVWSRGGLRVSTRLVPVEGDRGFFARYTVTNSGDKERDLSLVLALRPFQVLPHWQFLNITGGTSPVRRLTVDQNGIDAGAGVKFITLEPVGRAAASAFGSGEIFQRLSEGSIAFGRSAQVSDPAGLASGAWVYPMTLGAGQSRSVDVYMGEQSVAESFDECLASAESVWDDLLGSFWLRLPGTQRHLEDSVRASIAYVLVNQDRHAIQPGSRTYERTWIRDGSLTTHALLGAGLHGHATGFIDWYADHLFENGKAPCVVDHRGADPVDEHDSTGQYIHTVWSCYAFTRDRGVLERHFERVRRGVGYLRSLREQRLGGIYADPSSAEHVYFGLVPESISHEGYSAKPMHSYWDDFFVLLGLSDAANIADELGYAEEAREWRALEADFRVTLHDSIALAMRNHGIGYIPGCAELGDFDATSTAIAAFPVGELGSLPAGAVGATFERYWEMFVARRDGAMEWRDYTPYEVRVIGAMTDLGRPDRSHEMIDFFLSQQTPTGWRQWPEVVHRAVRGPGFIGDLPHTWVASDFVNSIASMLVHTDRDAARLTLGRGLRAEWLEGEGLRVEGLATALGEVSWSGRRDGGVYVFEVTRCERTPAEGIWLDLSWLPAGAEFADGSLVPGAVRVVVLPARIEISKP